MVDKSIEQISSPLIELKTLVKSIDNKVIEKLMINDNWNLNKTIAHLIGWAEQFRNEIEFLLGNQNKSFPWFISSKNNWSAFNDKNTEKYYSKNVVELIETFEQINDDIVKMVLANRGTDKLTIKHHIKYYGKYSPVTILEMLKMKNHHEVEHLEQIKLVMKSFSAS